MPPVYLGETQEKVVTPINSLSLWFKHHLSLKIKEPVAAGKAGRGGYQESTVNKGIVVGQI